MRETQEAWLNEVPQRHVKGRELCANHQAICGTMPSGAAQIGEGRRSLEKPTCPFLLIL